MYVATVSFTNGFDLKYNYIRQEVKAEYVVLYLEDGADLLIPFNNIYCIRYEDKIEEE